MILAIIGLLLGAILGRRSKVLVLVPASLVSIVCIALLGLVTSQDISLTSYVAAVLALDFGYMGMTALRFVFTPALRLRTAAAATLSKSAS